VLRHDDIAHDHKSITLTGLFKNRQEAVAAVCAIEKRQSPITRAGDKVQVMRAVTAMQSAGHKAHGIGSIVPALAQNARTGHPQFRNGKRKTWKGGPPAQPAGTVLGSSGLVHNNTEINASNVEINCLKNKLLHKTCDTCTQIINQRIKQMENYRDSFK